MEEKIIYHIDVNSAFLSWTAAYRVNVLGEAQDLRDIPSVIGGSEEKRHGIVLAKSISAKKYGIKTGEPLVSARRKCPNLIVVPPDYSLYVKNSKALIAILEEFAPKVEQYSIDEAWCEVTGTQKLYGSPVQAANELKDRIYRELGFTVNIGISNNKLLSKMASDFEKPNRVHTLFPHEIREKMWPLPVSELFFVGRVTCKKLNNLGIHTIGELACTDLSILKAHFKHHGEVIWNYANGKEIENAMGHQDANKGYGNSITTPYDIETYEGINHVLLSLCETVGARLRADKVQVSCISVSFVDSDFYHSSHQMQFMSATNVTEELYRAAVKLMRQMWDGKRPLRQIGVQTSKVTGKDAGRQYNLFDMERYEKLEKLNEAVDSIREKYGEDAIIRASFLDDTIPHLTGGLSKEKRTGGK